MKLDHLLLRWRNPVRSERPCKLASSLIQSLLPEFQGPSAKPEAGNTSKVGRPDTALASSKKPTQQRPRSQSLPNRDTVVEVTLVEHPLILTEPPTAERITGKGPWGKDLPRLVDPLVHFDRAWQSDDGPFGAIQ